MDILRIHTLSHYLTCQLLQVFFSFPLYRELLPIIFDFWSLLWCSYEHKMGNDALLAKRLLTSGGIDIVATECDCCLQNHYRLNNGCFFGDWNYSCFENLPISAFEEYDEWLNFWIHYYWKLADDRLYFSNGPITKEVTLRLLSTKPSQENMFENPLIPYYRETKEHRLIRSLKRKQHQLVQFANKRRRIPVETMIE